MMPKAIIRELERETGAALAEYRRAAVAECADHVASAGLPLFAGVSEDFAAGYLQAQDDFADMLHRAAEEG